MLESIRRFLPIFSVALTATAFGQTSPQTRLVPIAPPSAAAPRSLDSIAPPAFDPYRSTPAAPTGGFGLPPAPTYNPPLSAAPPPAAFNGGGRFGGLFGGVPASPAAGPTFQTSPNLLPPGTYDNPSVYGPPVGSGFGGGLAAPPPVGFPGATPAYPETIYPSGTPNTLFPGGLFNGNGPISGPAMRAYRNVQGLRARNGYVFSGDDPDALNVNTTDVSAIFAFPNFGYGTQPLYVIPSFGLHLFDGPDSVTGADLPGQTYDAFLDFGYVTDPNQMLGTELGVRVGVFSDFDHVSSDSLRVLGKGLVNFRLTPATTLKGGVYYLDRLDWKLIPAFGLLYQPNPYTRWDLFFPQPKFSRYLRTVGTRDVWWYLAGDYGGGSWTVTREDGDEERVDLNELRAMIGLEWGFSDGIRQGRRTAFAEVGYVFDRELVYEDNTGDNLQLDDGVLFRVGIGY